MIPINKALTDLHKEVALLPLEEQTLWNEACLDMAGILEKYPKLLEATSIVFYIRLKEGSL
jgi:hypothetical protein